jgi:hypothetical protein
VPVARRNYQRIYASPDHLAGDAALGGVPRRSEPVKYPELLDEGYEPWVAVRSM